MFKVYNKKNKINNIQPDLKRIKVSNSIVIGGMIAFGKSTLAKKIHDSIENSNIVFELNDDDALMKMLLEKMYERSNSILYGSVFQLYFVLNRFENYKQNCNREGITIFDRSIFEDWLFAHENIVRPSVFSYYNSLWNDVTTELIYQYGVPKLYVILTGSWELFEERLFNRNRKVEIDNYKKNKTYFKKLLDIYESYMINVCKDFGIDYIVVDASKDLDEKVDIVLKKIKSISDYQLFLKNSDTNNIFNFIKLNKLFNQNQFDNHLINKFINWLNNLLSNNELNIIQMRYGLMPYKTPKEYSEISNEFKISINKVKEYEKKILKKIKNNIRYFSTPK